MPTVKEICASISEAMPLLSCESWDNCGVLVGHTMQEVTKVLIALDVTLPVIEEAKREQCELIVSHHPVIFHPLSAITDEKPTGLVLESLIRNELSVISMHTNADVSDGGVNDLLAEKIGLTKVKSLKGGEGGTLGRYGELLLEMTLSSFLSHIAEALGPLKGARYIDAGIPVKRVAVGGGACGDLIYNAKKCGCDTFVTADIKYSTMLEAQAIGIHLIDAGHFETENVIVPRFMEIIQKGFPKIFVKVADSNVNPIQFF